MCSIFFSAIFVLLVPVCCNDANHGATTLKQRCMPPSGMDHLSPKVSPAPARSSPQGAVAGSCPWWEFRPITTGDLDKSNATSGRRSRRVPVPGAGHATDDRPSYAWIQGIAGWDNRLIIKTSSLPPIRGYDEANRRMRFSSRQQRHLNDALLIGSA